MFREIFEALILIISRTPVDNAMSVLGYHAVNDDYSRFNWRKFFNFFIFLSILSCIYFLVVGDIKSFFSAIGAMIVFYILEPSVDEDGKQYYPTWKLVIILTTLLVALVSLVFWLQSRGLVVLA